MAKCCATNGDNDWEDSGLAVSARWWWRSSNCRSSSKWWSSVDLNPGEGSPGEAGVADRRRAVRLFCTSAVKYGSSVSLSPEPILVTGRVEARSCKKSFFRATISELFVPDPCANKHETAETVTGPNNNPKLALGRRVPTGVRNF